ncbi:LuxR C-terminal-related transcriptional regulator [Streptomyces griseus]|uniref:LuxR C-terminal-related transcriptional regulator n=1 Tax=Streptomyces griseus TaxID=1911 RepID=UPI0006900F4A|nr:LuxR C-terminal-related transcriptional regulator [Streptomyces griseus]
MSTLPLPDRHSGRSGPRSSPTPGSLGDVLNRGLRGPGRLGALDVLKTAGATLTDSVPADVWCAVMLDPATFLDTGGQHEHGFPQRVMPRLFEIEHTEQAGVDNIRALARRPAPASLLSRSTGGRLDDNVYYRDILRPEGLADELRVLLRDGPRTWGLLVLCREEGSPPFSPADVERAATISSPAAVALRRSLLLAGIDRGDVPDAPGLVALDEGLGIRLCTSTADHWLGLIQEDHPAPGRSYPLCLEAIASKARACGPGVQVSSRALSRSGHWITLNAWREEPAGADGETLTYVSLSLSRPGELAAIVLDAYGLTPREREVAQQVLLGRSTAEVAAALHITDWTVQDHLRKVFDKAGVRSRRELTAELFLRYYLPYLDSPPLTTDGRMRGDDHDGQGAR